MLTNAPEGKKDSLRAWRWKHFEFEDQGKLNLFFFYKNKTAMDHTGYNTVLGIQYIYTVYIYSYGQKILYTLQYLQNINCFITKKNKIIKIISWMYLCFWTKQVIKWFSESLK